MGLSTAGRQAMHTGLAAVAGFASLHTTDPGSLGLVGEISGGSPAYARKAITWTVSGDFLDSTNTPTFDVPGGGTTPSHFGLWSLATGGVFYGSGTLASQETYTTQGQYQLLTADSLLT